MPSMKQTAVVMALVAGIAVAACGSTTTHTVTVTDTVTHSASAITTTTRSSSTSSTTSESTTHSSSSTTAPTATFSTTTSGTATTTTSSETTTRTETAPAFVGTNPNSSAASGPAETAAIAVLTHRGYAPVTTSTYDAGNTLRVLIGRRADGAEHAFFFDQTIYLGTDASAASAHISVISAGDTEVTLAYALRPSGQARVRFALDMGQLSALDPLPSAARRG